MRSLQCSKRLPPPPPLVSPPLCRYALKELIFSPEDGEALFINCGGHRVKVMGMPGECDSDDSDEDESLGGGKAGLAGCHGKGGATRSQIAGRANSC